MSDPALIVMAAGIGSRYGGLKQIEPVGPSGELIIDYSLYDALRAGFRKVVFIIRKELEHAFRGRIGWRLEKRCQVEYVYQELDDLPHGFAPPAGRKKPWGTAHAVYAARNKVNENFGVINADDYYGAESYKLLWAHLAGAKDTDGVGDYCLVGYRLRNTLSPHGHVARGICETDNAGYLIRIKERTRIQWFGDEVKYLDDDGITWVSVSGDSIASMNFWGFTPGFLDVLQERFPGWLKQHKDDSAAEWFLPDTVGKLVVSGRARVKVLNTQERWFGITYRDDEPGFKAMISELVTRGQYSKDLWGETDGATA